MLLQFDILQIEKELILIRVNHVHRVLSNFQINIPTYESFWRKIKFKISSQPFIRFQAL